MVYLKSTKEGLVVAGLNNPWHTQDLDKEVLCKNICAIIKWLGVWSKTDADRGYTFCCEYNDFMKFYKNVIPLMQVDKILKK
jgi:hypothetical protein